MGRPVVDIFNIRFGNLVVLERVSSKNNRIRWKCLCDCGNITYADSGNIKKGQKKSCGCLVKQNGGLPKNLVGNRFNRLLVINFHHIDWRGGYMWECQCDCGNSIIVRGDSLTSRNTQSCGCLRLERIVDAVSKITGNLRWNWKGGISKKYPQEWNKQLREFIRNRDNHKCQFPECNFSDICENEKLSVHHIDGDKNYCHPSNLISLCRNHHSHIENNNPKKWMGYFYSITQDYEEQKQ